MTFGDFLKDQEQAFHQPCQFIGIEKTPTMLLSTRNKGGVPKSSAFNILKNRALVKATRKVLPGSMHAQLDNFVKSNFFKKASLKPSQKDVLSEVFYRDIEKTSTLIGRDLCEEWQLNDSFEKVNA